MVHVPNSAAAKVLSFVRRDAHSQVLVVINFSHQAQSVTLHEGLYPGAYTDYFAGQSVELAAESTLTLKPWEYRVYLRDLAP